MKLNLLQYLPKKGWTGERPGPGGENTAVFVFGGRSFLEDAEAFDRLRRDFPTAHIVGCSSAGEIFGEQVFDETLSVAAATFAHTSLKTASVSIRDYTSSRGLGREISRRMSAPGLHAVMVFSDGLGVNGSELVNGLRENLSSGVTVTGGLAGDGDRFEQTWVIADGRPRTGWVTALGFYGRKIHIGHGSQGGWDAFGPEKLITRSSSNILYELDGRPALQVYKDYLGDQADHLPGSALLFPLALRVPGHEEKQIVRTVLSVNEKTNSMTFAGDVPEGSVTQLMRANIDKLVTGAFQAGAAAGEMALGRLPALSIAISCVGRRMLLKERVADEVRATLRHLPPGARQIGFYSYGEISPHVRGEACELHNQTMTLTVIQEEED